MTYRPGFLEPVPPMVSPWTDGWGIGIHEGISTSAPASATYESANRGVWFQVYIPSVCVAKRMWWANGTSVTGNVEAGIYLDRATGGYPGVKLVTTGSVAQASTNTVQFADITDTTLPPGLVWLYISASSASATFFRSTTSGSPFALLGAQQVSIGPGSAPATATPTQRSGSTIYLFGFSTTTIT